MSTARRPRQASQWGSYCCDVIEIGEVFAAFAIARREATLDAADNSLLVGASLIATPVSGRGLADRSPAVRVDVDVNEESNPTPATSSELNAVMDLVGIQPETGYVAHVELVVADPESGAPRSVALPDFHFRTLRLPTLVRCLRRSSWAIEVNIARQDPTEDGRDGSCDFIEPTVAELSQWSYQVKVMAVANQKATRSLSLVASPTVSIVEQPDRCCVVNGLLAQTTYVLQVRSKSARREFWGPFGGPVRVSTLPLVNVAVSSINYASATIKSGQEEDAAEWVGNRDVPALPVAGSVVFPEVTVRIAARQSVGNLVHSSGHFGSSTIGENDSDEEGEESGADEEPLDPTLGSATVTKSLPDAVLNAVASGDPTIIPELQPRTTYVLEYFARTPDFGIKASATASPHDIDGPPEEDANPFGEEPSMVAMGRGGTLSMANIAEHDVTDGGTPAEPEHYVGRSIVSTPALRKASVDGKQQHSAEGVILNQGAAEQKTSSPSASRRASRATGPRASVQAAEVAFRREAIARLLQQVNPVALLTIENVTDGGAQFRWASDIVHVCSQALENGEDSDVLAVAGKTISRTKLCFTVRLVKLPRGRTRAPKFFTRIVPEEEYGHPSATAQELLDLRKHANKHLDKDLKMAYWDEAGNREELTCRQFMVSRMKPRLQVPGLEPDSRYVITVAGAWMPTESELRAMDPNSKVQLTWQPFCDTQSFITLYAPPSLELLAFTPDGFIAQSPEMLSELEARMATDAEYGRIKESHEGQRAQTVISCELTCLTNMKHSRVHASVRERKTGRINIAACRFDGAYAAKVRIALDKGGTRFGTSSDSLQMLVFHGNATDVESIEDGMRVRFHTPLTGISKFDARRTRGRAGSMYKSRSSVFSPNSPEKGADKPTESTATTSNAFSSPVAPPGSLEGSVGAAEGSPLRRGRASTFAVASPRRRATTVVSMRQPTEAPFAEQPSLADVNATSITQEPKAAEEEPSPLSTIQRVRSSSIFASESMANFDYEKLSIAPAAAEAFIALKGYVDVSTGSKSVGVPLVEEELAKHEVDITALRPGSYAVSVRFVAVPAEALTKFHPRVTPGRRRSGTLDGQSSAGQLEKMRSNSLTAAPTLGTFSSGSFGDPSRMSVAEVNDSVLKAIHDKHYDSLPGTIYRRHEAVVLQVGENELSVAAAVVARSLFPDRMNEDPLSAAAGSDIGTDEASDGSASPSRRSPSRRSPSTSRRGSPRSSPRHSPSGTPRNASPYGSPRTSGTLQHLNSASSLLGSGSPAGSMIGLPTAFQSIRRRQIELLGMLASEENTNSAPVHGRRGKAMKYPELRGNPAPLLAVTEAQDSQFKALDGELQRLRSFAATAIANAALEARSNKAAAEGEKDPMEGSMSRRRSSTVTFSAPPPKSRIEEDWLRRDIAVVQIEIDPVVGEGESKPSGVWPRVLSYNPANEDQVGLGGLRSNTEFKVRLRVQGRFNSATGSTPGWSAYSRPLLVRTSPKFNLTCAAATENAVVLQWQRPVRLLSGESLFAPPSAAIASSSGRQGSVSSQAASSKRGKALMRDVNLRCLDVRLTGETLDLRDKSSKPANEKSERGGSEAVRSPRSSSSRGDSMSSGGGSRTTSPRQSRASRTSRTSRSSTQHGLLTGLHRPYLRGVYANAVPIELEVILTDPDDPEESAEARREPLQTSVVLLHPGENGIRIRDLYPGMKYTFRIRGMAAQPIQEPSNAPQQQPRSGKWSGRLAVCTLSDITATLPKLGTTYCTISVQRVTHEMAKILREEARERRRRSAEGKLLGEDLQTATGNRSRTGSLKSPQLNPKLLAKPAAPSPYSDDDQEEDIEPEETAINTVFGYEARIRWLDAELRVRAIPSARQRTHVWTPRMRRSTAATTGGPDGDRSHQDETKRGDTLIPNIPADGIAECRVEDLVPDGHYELSLRPNIVGGLNGQWNPILRFRTLDFAKLAVVTCCEDMAMLRWAAPVAHPVEMIHQTSAAGNTIGLRADHPPVGFAVRTMEVLVEGKRLHPNNRSLIHSIDEQRDETPVSESVQVIEAPRKTVANLVEVAERTFNVDALFPDTIYSLRCRFKDFNDEWTPFGGELKVMTRPALAARMVSVGEHYGVVQLLRRPRSEESEQAILQHIATSRVFLRSAPEREAQIKALTEKLRTGKGIHNDAEEEEVRVQLEHAIIARESVVDSNLVFSAQQHLDPAATGGVPSAGDALGDSINSSTSNVSAQSNQQSGAVSAPGSKALTETSLPIDPAERHLYDLGRAKLEVKVIDDRNSTLGSVTRESLMGEAPAYGSGNAASTFKYKRETPEITSLCGLTSRARYSLLLRVVHPTDSDVVLDGSPRAAKWRCGMWSDILTFETLPSVKWSFMLASTESLVMRVHRPLDRLVPASLATTLMKVPNPSVDPKKADKLAENLLDLIEANRVNAKAGEDAPVHTSDRYQLSINDQTMLDVVRLKRGETRVLHITGLPRNSDVIRVAIRNQFVMTDLPEAAEIAEATNITFTSHWTKASGPAFTAMRTMPLRPSTPMLYEYRGDHLAFWWSLAMDEKTKFPSSVVSHDDKLRAHRHRERAAQRPSSTELDSTTASAALGSTTWEGTGETADEDDIVREVEPHSTVAFQCRQLACCFDDEARDLASAREELDNVLVANAAVLVTIDGSVAPVFAAGAFEGLGLDGILTNSPYSYEVQVAQLADHAGVSPFEKFTTVRLPFLRCKLPGHFNDRQTPLVFRVRTVVSLGEGNTSASPWSPVTSWRRPPPPPPVTGLRVEVDSAQTQATVHFSYPTWGQHNQLHFKVWYGAGAHQHLCVREPTAAVGPLEPQHQYRFRVAAINTFGESTVSPTYVMTARHHRWHVDADTNARIRERGTSPDGRDVTDVGSWGVIDADASSIDDPAAFRWPYPNSLRSDFIPPAAPTNFHFDASVDIRRARRGHPERVVDIGRMPPMIAAKVEPIEGVAGRAVLSLFDKSASGSASFEGYAWQVLASAASIENPRPPSILRPASIVDDAPSPEELDGIIASSSTFIAQRSGADHIPRDPIHRLRKIDMELNRRGAETPIRVARVVEPNRDDDDEDLDGNEDDGRSRRATDPQAASHVAGARGEDELELEESSVAPPAARRKTAVRSGSKVGGSDETEAEAEAEGEAEPEEEAIDVEPPTASPTSPGPPSKFNSRSSSSAAPPQRRRGTEAPTKHADGDSSARESPRSSIRPPPAFPVQPPRAAEEPDVRHVRYENDPAAIVAMVRDPTDRKFTAEGLVRFITGRPLRPQPPAVVAATPPHSSPIPEPTTIQQHSGSSSPAGDVPLMVPFTASDALFLFNDNSTAEAIPHPFGAVKSSRSRPTSAHRRLYSTPTSTSSSRPASSMRVGSSASGRADTFDWRSVRPSSSMVKTRPTSARPQRTGPGATQAQKGLGDHRPTRPQSAPAQRHNRPRTNNTQQQHEQ